MISLAIIAPHPVQYHAPLFKEVEKLHNVDSMILYCDDMGLEAIYVDEFKTTIKWDVSLLDGYKYKFLKNYSRKAVSGFFSRVNPVLFSDIFKNKYDVILISGYDNLSCWFSLFAAKLKGAKVIWRGESILKGNESLFSWKMALKKVILRRFFNACDAVMYSCTGNKDYLKYYGVPGSKLFPIPCAVDNDYFRSERDKYINKRDDIRTELEIDSADLVVLFSARFTSRKRPFDLLKAIKKLKYKGVTVLFVGDGVEKNDMESYAIKHIIKAKFVGFQNQGEISKYYSIADVAIVISDYDPSPKAINEAMNFELPIIVSDAVGTATDLVVHGENGFVVKVGDVDAIAGHIAYFCKERWAVKEMGKKSRGIVKEWNFQKDAKSVEKAIRFVMHQ